MILGEAQYMGCRSRAAKSSRAGIIVPVKPLPVRIVPAESVPVPVQPLTVTVPAESLPVQVVPLTVPPPPASRAFPGGALTVPLAQDQGRGAGPPHTDY